MFWNRFPFARILFPFLTGIITAVYFSYTQPVPLYILFILFFIYTSLVVVFQKILPYGFRWVSGSALILFFLLSGYQLKVLHDAANVPNYFGQYLSDKGVSVCRLTEPLQEKERTYKAIVEVSSIKDSAVWHKTSGKAIIYFEKDSLSKQLKYGDNIMVFGNFNSVNPPMNPGEFDYKVYLQNRSVEYSAFVKKNKWQPLSADNGYLIFKYAYDFRQKLLSILDKSEMSGREYGVISALLIGYTDKLDPDLIKDYQGSGAMHILSVSGMHVGVIYLVLNFFLFFFDKFKYGRVPKAVILILFVWCYAILTGLSPAVLRAATMFSFIAIGNAFKYPSNVFNTLAASAFVLLLFNPYFITDVGFQLSYLSVIGIVSIYPYIYKSWYSRYWLMDKIWSLISVSIAAQIVTFPLSLFYFHQFPNYFILTNMAAVPLSALVIYLGIAYLVFYSVPYLSVFCAKALTWSLLGLNGSISYIEGLPYSVSRSISISGPEMILLYLILAFVFIFLVFRKPKTLITALILLLFFFCSVSSHNYKLARQKKIIVYNISRHTAIDFVNGNLCYFVTDSTIRNDPKKQEFQIANSRIQFNSHVSDNFLISNDHSIQTDNVFYKKDRFIFFAGKSMTIVNENTANTNQISVDFLLLSNNPDISMDALLKQYKPGLIIIDASNYTKNTEKWINQCKQRNILYYVTTKSGAWIFEI